MIKFPYRLPNAHCISTQMSHSKGIKSNSGCLTICAILYLSVCLVVSMESNIYASAYQPRKSIIMIISLPALTTRTLKLILKLSCRTQFVSESCLFKKKKTLNIYLLPQIIDRYIEIKIISYIIYCSKAPSILSKI